MAEQDILRAIAKFSRKAGQWFAPQPVATPMTRAPEPAVFSPLLDDADAAGAPVRLLVFADGPGATQTISFDLPLEAARRASAIRLTILSEADFAGLNPAAADAAALAALEQYDPTHVIVSRFGGPGASGIATACERRGLPFVMHLDDNLFEVPAALGAAKFNKYNEPARQARMRLLCERSSVIYASTGELARQLSARGFKPPVEAGEMYCAAPCLPAPHAPSEPPVIGYMGTSGHASDLEMIVPAISAVLQAHPGARFETFGSIKMPKSLQAEFAGRTSARPAAGSYREFIAAFQAMRWSVGLAPLEDTPFNACKANTKFIEYAVAGIPCVASDTAVYQATVAGGRGLLARTTEQWTGAVNQLLSDPDKARAMVEVAQVDLADRWSQARLLAQLVRITGLPESLLDHRPKESPQ